MLVTGCISSVRPTNAPADRHITMYCRSLPCLVSGLRVLLSPAPRQHGAPGKAAAAADQFLCRAHFAAGQLVSKLSSSCKGQQLISAVLEAIDSIMKGVELASANPRWALHMLTHSRVQLGCCEKQLLWECYSAPITFGQPPT